MKSKCNCGASVRREGNHRPECAEVDLRATLGDDVAPIVEMAALAVETVTKHALRNNHSHGFAVLAGLMASAILARELRPDMPRARMREQLVSDAGFTFDLAMSLVDGGVIATQRRHLVDQS